MAITPQIPKSEFFFDFDGNPEGFIDAPINAVCRDTSSATTYTKTTGLGTKTGWVPVGSGSNTKTFQFNANTGTPFESPLFTLLASVFHPTLLRLTGGACDTTSDPLDPSQNPFGGTVWLNISGSHWALIGELFGGTNLGGQAGETASFMFFANTILSLEYGGDASNNCVLGLVAEQFSL